MIGPVVEPKAIIEVEKYLIAYFDAMKLSAISAVGNPFWAARTALDLSGCPDWLAKDIDRLAIRALL